MTEKMTKAQVEDAAWADDTEQLLYSDDGWQDVYLTKDGLLIEHRDGREWLVHRLPVEKVDEARSAIMEALERAEDEDYGDDDQGEIDSLLEGAFALGDPVKVEG